jgi:hypothetical protein
MILPHSFQLQKKHRNGLAHDIAAELLPDCPSLHEAVFDSWSLEKILFRRLHGSIPISLFRLA